MVIRIYWPKNVLETERSMGGRSAIIVGWNNNNTDLVVVATLPYLDPEFVEQLLQQDKTLSSALSGKRHNTSSTSLLSPTPSSSSLHLHHHLHHGRNNSRSSSYGLGLPQLCVLGTLNAGEQEQDPHFPISGHFNHSRVYLRVTLAKEVSSYPLHNIYSPEPNVYNGGAKYGELSFETSSSSSSYANTLKSKHRKRHSRHNNHHHHREPSSSFLAGHSNGQESFQVLLFRPPTARRMQYFSARPIGLALEEKSTLELVDEEYEKGLLEEQHIEQVHVAGTRSHSVRNRRDALDHAEVANACLTQMNCSGELGHALQKNCERLFPQLAERQHQFLMQQRRTRRSMSQSMVRSAQKVNKGLFNFLSMILSSIIPLFNQVCIWFLVLGRVLAEGALRVVEWRPLPLFCLKDVSALAQQFDLRLQQYCFWPLQYIRVRKRLASDSWPLNLPAGNVEYIRFYNSIWLVANDIILGIAICGLIQDNDSTILKHLNVAIDKYLIEQPRASILWLMGWPGGLKLNTELAHFLGELFLWVIEFWSHLLAYFRQYLPSILRLLAYSGFLGVTFTTSILCDLISFCTIHCYASYLASARLFRYQLLSLHSLSLLFRGQKRNVLRNRIDSCNYELDQLLVGTLLFMFQLFLLPTVGVFYLFFAFWRLSIVVVCAALESILACLNHFPLFALLLRAKDSHRLPGGLKVSFIGSSNDGSHIYVDIQSVPLAYGNIFKSYRTLGHRLRLHYLSFGVITRIMTGQFVPIQRSKLYGLLYSMLPARRASISTVFEELKSWL